MNEHNYHPYRWALHSLTVAYFTMGFIVRFAWPPLIPIAAPELGMNMAAAGSYMSAFYIGYVLIHIPGGMLGDRFGVRIVITLALCIEALASLGMGFANTFMIGFVLRILAGLGAGMVYSSCVRCISTWFPEKERGLAFGLMMIAPTGGGVLLPNLLMPWLNNLFAWRGAFMAVGVMALILAVCSFTLLRDTGKPQKGRSFFEGVHFIISKKALIIMCLVGFCLMWSMISFISWGNAYVKSLGFNMAESSTVMMLFALGGIIAPPLVGSLCNKYDPRDLLKYSLAAVAISVPIFGMQSSLLNLGLCAVLVGFIYGAANPPLPLIIAKLSGIEWAATAGGVSGCIFQIGSILGPAIIGISIDSTGNYEMAWILMAVAPIIGILLLRIKV